LQIAQPRGDRRYLRIGGGLVSTFFEIRVDCGEPHVASRRDSKYVGVAHSSNVLSRRRSSSGSLGFGITCLMPERSMKSSIGVFIGVALYRATLISAIIGSARSALMN